MLIKELQLLSEALYESVKSDIKFFSPISTYVKKLAEYDYINVRKDDLKEIKIYSDNIEEFFDKYRASGESFYFPPIQTSNNDSTVKKLYSIVNKLQTISDEELIKEIEFIKPRTRNKTNGEGFIFIGHGNSKIWARVNTYIKDELKLNTLYFESESHASESIVNVINSFLDKSSYAILIMTAEDETREGKERARQNVIHEAGLFQGRLGFDKVIILKEDKTEIFTNISGLQYIPFSGDKIEQTFYDLQRKLKKLGLIKS